MIRRKGQDNVVVVGGYGAVGRTVCTELAQRFPGRVFAAGRNMRKAEAFSEETGGRVLPLKLDMTDLSDAAKALDGARVVVACAETGDIGFARACLERGIHYVDILASYGFLSKIERLDALARRRGATGVLSVGLAPGLTNLLASRCARMLDSVRSLDISVLLGLGEAHGEAAVRWTVENLDARFTVPGVPETVGSLEDPRTVLFPGEYGRRTAYRFDFSDQHVLARTLGVEKVATRLCFDSATATRLLALARRAGAFRALKSRWARDALVALLSRLRLGSDGFSVKVEAEGAVDGYPGTYSGSVSGRGEGYATGIVAASVAERLYAAPCERGVLHIEQLFEASAMFDQITAHGLTVVLDPPPG